MVEPEASPVPDPSGTEPDEGYSGSGDAENGTGDTSVKRILVYHSHPREAYNPLLGAQSDNPSSAVPSKNVMLVGSYIAKRLEERGSELSMPRRTMLQRYRATTGTSLINIHV